ncbi:hypothetical protein QOZ80_1BG0090240 [Eleusine coracana subsp. coracana]|nr:hypothetical protein QOZ80_1BG0090240 [Eleusine coracana subsp. coracana]
MSSSSSSSSTITTAAVKTEAGTEAAGGNSLLSVTLISQNAPPVTYRIRRDVRLRRLMDLYCGKNSLDPNAVVLLDSCGRHIRPAQTPDEVGLKDGDEIDIMLWVDGGGAATLVHLGQISA